MKNIFHSKNVILKLFFLICFSLISFSIFAEDSVITIESADSTSFEKDKETGEEQIVLKGAVSISVKKGDVFIKISSSYVSFNRTTDMLFAQGNVELTQTSASQGNQNVSASSLLMNVSTLEGVFDDGRIFQTQSDAINLPSGSVLVVSSDMLGKDSKDTIAFKNGDLTFCDAENPHWKIKASNIWLLPGGEFAFFNALLFIGNIPILYLPAFYYPKDELIFNPSFGYDTRSGYYFQTTTYLYGRKPLDNGSSSSSSNDANNTAQEVGAALYDFMRPSELKQQVREGLVLHNLNESYKGSTSDYVKLLGDYYSNLGGMIGVEAVLNPKNVITSLNASLKMGFSNTLFPMEENKYSPYSYTGKTYYDNSTFLGLHLPFRYSANLNLSINKPFNFSLSLPIYSDPYFTEDFGKRSEYLDWIGYLMNGIDSGENKGTQVTTFTWSASASYNVPLPAWIKPYVTNLSITELSSSIVFGHKKNLDLENEVARYSPEREFFSPSNIYPVKFSGKISGTIIDTSTKNNNSSLNKSENPKFAVELVKPDLLDDSSESEKEKSNENQNEAKKEENEKSDFIEFSLPNLALTDKKINANNFAGPVYSLTYAISPSYTSQISYLNNSESPKEFDWEKIYSSYIQFQSPLNLNSNFSVGGSFFALKNTLNFTPAYQVHPNMDGYTDKKGIETVKLIDYRAKKLDLSGTNNISFRPFVSNSIFKNTGLDWSSSVKYISTNFIGDVENPEWEYKPVDFKDEKSITSHSFSAKFSAEEMKDFSQVVTLSTNLPPQSEKYDADLALVFPYVSMNLSAGLKHKDNDNDKEWEKIPFKESMKIKLLNNMLVFSQDYKYDFENKISDSLNLSFSVQQWLQISYSMKYTNHWHYEKENGWIMDSKDFIPNNLSFNLSTPSKTFNWWGDKVSFAPSVSTSIVCDLIKPTSSYLRFSPSLKFKINNFIDLTFSSETRNNVIYRYIQKYNDSELRIAGEENVFRDLWNSFVFWSDDAFYDPDQLKRKSSGFKLKSLSVSLTHDLHDWDLKSTFSITPRLQTNANGQKSYDFSPSFSFNVTWRPMSSMKAEIVDEYGTWKLK